MKRKIMKILTLLIVMLSFLTEVTLAGIEDNENINLKEIEKEVIETISVLDNEPILNSRIATVYDRESGKIIYDKNGDKQTPMASTTKIMTAIIVLENSNLQDVVTVDAKSASVSGSRLGLKKNDKITVHDLLYGLMLRSGNDAAAALARYVGGSIEGFAELMNQKCIELGLVNSHYVVPHGLDTEGHYTTAYELAKLTDYALNIEKFRNIVSTKTYTVTINGRAKTISNTNELLGNLSGVYGVKTGFTNGAGRCLVTACKRNDLNIIVVVIGADTKKNRTSDSMKLIEYTYKNYQKVNIKEIVEEQFETWRKINENRIVINKGETDFINLELEKLSYEKTAILNTQINNINIEINSLYYLNSPVEAKKVIGNLKIKIGDEVIDVLNIYNKKEIKQKDVKHYLIEFLEIYCRR